MISLSMEKIKLLLFASLISCLAFGQKESISLKKISNPFVKGYFADPAVIKHDDKYYVYATFDPWGGDSLACFVSGDFKNWQRILLNWPTKQQCASPQSNKNKVWAPGVIKGLDNRFHMFVSVGSEVYAGVADRPEGPWKNVRKDNGPFIATQRSINVHTIDAEPFIDDDGKVYLYWGSGWDWKDGRCYIAELNTSMDSIISKPIDITPPNYFEAPFMVKYEDKYYLMYSDGNCTDTSYKVRYAVSNHPSGPWKEGANSPVLSSGMKKNILGPGHHAVLKEKNKYYILYHRIKSLNEKDLLRELCIDELKFDKSGNIQKVKTRK